jgi:6-phosphogluconolactonase
VNPVEMIRFPGPGELAATVAENWLNTLRGDSSDAPYHVALSGGRITQAFFASIVAGCERQKAPLERVHFFWADERCVPPTDPESNFAVAQSLLFGPLGISESRIHAINGAIVPEASVAQMVEDVRGTIPLDGRQQPVFDMVFLGMGEDGHVASLFPEESEEAGRDAAIYRPVTASKPPPRRITLGYAALAAAKQVWVLASGQGKEQALRNSLLEKPVTPLGRVLKMRQNTRILTDIPERNPGDDLPIS